MRVLANHVIVRISAEERRKLFDVPVKRNDGSLVWLNVNQEAEAFTDKWYEQSVTVGEVLAVGAHVKNIHPGDLAIMDYTVDKTAEHVLWENEEEKCIRVLAVSSFKQAREVIPANRRTPHPTLLCNAGDPDELSNIIGVVRNGTIYPVFPYIFLEYEGIDDEWKQRDGSVLYTQQLIEPVVYRTVSFVSEQSQFRPGQRLAFDVEDLFERMFEGKRFDIGWERVVMGVSEPNKQLTEAL